MLDPVEIQLWRLSVLFVLGTGCNVVFHLYTAIRAVMRPSRILRHILDWITAMVVLGLTLAIIFVVNYGEMRLYIPVSIAAGFFASQFFLGNLLYSLFYSMVKGLVALLRWMKNHLVMPLIGVLTWLFRPFYFRPKPPEGPGGKGPEDEGPEDKGPEDKGPGGGSYKGEEYGDPYQPPKEPPNNPRERS